MSVNSKMTAIADEIRELSGSTGTMGLDAMAIKLDDANDEVASQAGLIEQIVSALDGKAGGEQATPVISVNSTNGLITATAGTKTSTHQLAFQAAKTITPSTASQTAVAANTYTGGAITVAAIPSTYIQPTGTKTVTTNGTHDVKDYASVNVSVASSGGNTDVEDGLITGTLTTYTNNRVTVIGDYAFCNCTSLTSVSFPVAISIGSSAFCYCTNLISVSFPVTTSIGDSAFYNCSNLTTVSFPAVKTIGFYAFRSCINLTSISFPVATIVNSGAFEHCSKLTSINFPKVTAIGSDAFCYCTSLTSVSFPAAITISGYAFYSCRSLTSVSFPVATTIGYFTFYSCSNLKSIYLTASTICSLAGLNAFSYTGIWSTTGSIYVPSSLVASYKTATNWAFFSNRIFSAP